MALSYKVNVPTGTQVAAGNAEFSAARVEEYLNNQTGLLSSIGGGQALGQYYPTTTDDFIESTPADSSLIFPLQLGKSSPSPTAKSSASPRVTSWTRSPRTGPRPTTSP